ncbi:hypothetical protein VFPPC_11097 [Pochonia chlamydosporia 170]|uniref:Uncharacterized protein n=1 Tax=Pochonia chlamydosporia 170 TaxID=1380566 RepID=A0A179FBI5_METCM|nr:hypothetical protein VFPPC_11097 [Pochonia chlamydosporia 170]OAQ62641.1 hypothetical protein VFPPC_11097 [Pochonia chlamydosporia 170]
MKVKAALVSLLVGLASAAPQGIQFPKDNGNGCAQGIPSTAPDGQKVCIATNGDILSPKGDVLASFGNGGKDAAAIPVPKGNKPGCPVLFDTCTTFPGCVIEDANGCEISAAIK